MPKIPKSLNTKILCALVWSMVRYATTKNCKVNRMHEYRLKIYLIGICTIIEWQSKLSQNCLLSYIKFNEKGSSALTRTVCFRPSGLSAFDWTRTVRFDSRPSTLDMISTCIVQVSFQPYKVGPRITFLISIWVFNFNCSFPTSLILSKLNQNFSNSVVPSNFSPNFPTSYFPISCQIFQLLVFPNCSFQLTVYVSPII